jgi:DNA replication protein DnaC
MSNAVEEIEEFVINIPKRSPEEAEMIRKQIEAEELAARQKSKWTRWAKMNLPARNAICIPADDDAEFVSKMMTIWRRIGTGITAAIIGLRGRGKTQLGVELLKQNGGLFIYGAEIGMKLRNFDTAESVMDELVEKKLLVIDEAFKKQESDWMATQFFLLLSKRHAACRDTILIDNLDRKQFEAAAGDSIVSRINESGVLLECTSKNYRDNYTPPENMAEELAGYNEARRMVK